MKETEFNVQKEDKYLKKKVKQEKDNVEDDDYEKAKYYGDQFGGGD